MGDHKILRAVNIYDKPSSQCRSAKQISNIYIVDLGCYPFEILLMPKKLQVLILVHDYAPRIF